MRISGEAGEAMSCPGVLVGRIQQEQGNSLGHSKKGERETQQMQATVSHTLFRQAWHLHLR